MYLILAVKDDSKHVLLGSADTASAALAQWEAARGNHAELVIADGTAGPIDHAELSRRADAERIA